MVLKFPIFFLREALKRSEHKHLLEYVSACAHVCIFVQCVHNVWVCVCAMYEHVWLHLYIYHINKWQIFMFTEIIGKLSKYIYISFHKILFCPEIYINVSVQICDFRYSPTFITVQCSFNCRCQFLKYEET